MTKSLKRSESSEDGCADEQSSACAGCIRNRRDGWRRGGSGNCWTPKHPSTVYGFAYSRPWCQPFGSRQRVHAAVLRKARISSEGYSLLDESSAERGCQRRSTDLYHTRRTRPCRQVTDLLTGSRVRSMTKGKTVQDVHPMAFLSGARGYCEAANALVGLSKDTPAISDPIYFL